MPRKEAQQEQESQELEQEQETSAAEGGGSPAREVLDADAGEITQDTAAKTVMGLEEKAQQAEQERQKKLAPQEKLVAKTTVGAGTNGVLYATHRNDPNEVNSQAKEKIRVKEYVMRKIGVRWYELYPDRTYMVPENVHRVLRKADLLTVV